MTVFVCQGCRRDTNSVCCNSKRGQPPTKCYAAWEEDHWVKGCGFDEASDFDKAFAMHMITGRPTENFLVKEDPSKKRR
jgi:hypothetical protein